MMAAVRRSLDQGLIATSTAAAAFLVHQTRYLLVPDAAASDDHGYLSFAPEVLIFAIALAAGLALRAAVVRGPQRVALRDRPLLRWLLCSVALVAIFGTQELLEGHVASVVGHGGLAVLPIAAGFGFALAQLLKRGRSVIAALAEKIRGQWLTRLPRPVRTFSSTARDAAAPRPPALARIGAGRAPPSMVSPQLS
jgi:hypothetical protein